MSRASKTIRVLALAAVVTTFPAGTAAAAPAKRFAPKLDLLSAVRGRDARIVDSRGREVQLRGVNVNQLGDYYAKNEHPPSAPLLRSDFVRMRELGFNHVRLVTNWSLWEPSPGQYSTEYLHQVMQAVRWAKQQGLYTLIDMHQDAWGKYIAATPSTVCPPGLGPNLGWDGAPEWATLDGGQLRCAVNETRELSAAVAQSFQNFWDDAAGSGGIGIQTRLVSLWRWIARHFEGTDAVMGYDLMNEPNPGFAATGAEADTIDPYYERAIAAIREVDQRHIIYVEPTVLRSGFPELIVMPEIDDDPNLVYAPHIYGDRNNPNHPNPGHVNEQQEWVDGIFKEARDAGGGADTALPVYIGEFGALDPPARDEYNSEFMALADKYRVPWSHWVWKDTCGDPHTGYGPFPDESFDAYDCNTESFTGLKKNRVFHYSRPYPQRTVGRLTRLSFNEQTKRFVLKARNVAGEVDRGRAARTFVWIPIDEHYGGKLDRAQIRVKNAKAMRLRTLPDGNALLSVRPGAGAYKIRIRRRPG